eukprot:COSAG02_NODE_8565_length_2522_cov_2.349979_1_plen_52_part_00
MLAAMHVMIRANVSNRAEGKVLSGLCGMALLVLAPCLATINKMCTMFHHSI